MEIEVSDDIRLFFLFERGRVGRLPCLVLEIPVSTKEPEYSAGSGNIVSGRIYGGNLCRKTEICRTKAASV